MLSKKCPGQDSRYWTPDDITEKKCGNCGYLVEFLKADLVILCPECGKKLINPKFNLGCAEWCDRSEECLGSIAKTYGKTESIRATIEQKAKGVLKNKESDFEHNLRVASYAEKIGKEEQVNLLLIILPSLLHNISLEKGKKIMENEELSVQIMEEVMSIIENFKSGTENNILVNIVSDAHNLDKINSSYGHDFPQKLEKIFRTDAGKKIAQEKH